LPDPLDEKAKQTAETNDDLLDFFKESFSAEDYRDVVAAINIGANTGRRFSCIYYKTEKVYSGEFSDSTN